MSVSFLGVLAALAPACILFSGSTVLFCKRRTLWSLLQLVGAGCFVVVVLSLIFEALHMFPWMNWGSNNSVCHYLDLWSAVLGLTLFPLGYLFHALRHYSAS